MTAHELRERLSVLTSYSVALDAIQHAARLEAENKQLRGLLEDVINAIGPPKVVYIGSAHNRYEVAYEADIDDPIKRSRAALAAAEENT